MWGRGREGALVPAPLSARFQSLPSPPTIKLGASSADSWVGGWACACSRPLWVSPTNSSVSLGVSPTAASTPTGVFNQRFEALFPDTGTLGCVVCFAPPAVPPGLSTHDCGTAGSGSHYHVGSDSYSLACPIPQTSTLLGPPAAALPWVFSAPAARLRPSYGSRWLFLLYVLGCRTSYSLIFCQFWSFFVFKLSFFWLCEDIQCVYLCLHLSRKPRSLNIQKWSEEKSFSLWWAGFRETMSQINHETKNRKLKNHIGRSALPAGSGKKGKVCVCLCQLTHSGRSQLPYWQASSPV